MTLNHLIVVAIMKLTVLRYSSIAM